MLNLGPAFVALPFAASRLGILLFVCILCACAFITHFSTRALIRMADAIHTTTTTTAASAAGEFGGARTPSHAHAQLPPLPPADAGVTTADTLEDLFEVAFCGDSRPAMSAASFAGRFGAQLLTAGAAVGVLLAELSVFGDSLPRTINRLAHHAGHGGSGGDDINSHDDDDGGEHTHGLFVQGTANQRRLAITLGAVCVLPLCLQRSLPALSIPSIIGVAAMAVATLLVIVGFGLAHPDGGDSQADDHDHGSNLDPSRILFPHNFNVQTILPAIAVMLFGFGCQHRIFAVYRAIRRRSPDRWNKVVSRSLLITVPLYMLFGVFGYLSTNSDAVDWFLTYDKRNLAVDMARIVIGLKMLFTFPFDFMIVYTTWRRSVRKLRWVLQQQVLEEDAQAAIAVAEMQNMAGPLDADGDTDTLRSSATALSASSRLRRSLISFLQMIDVSYTARNGDGDGEEASIRQDVADGWRRSDAFAPLLHPSTSSAGSMRFAPGGQAVSVADGGNDSGRPSDVHMSASAPAPGTLASAQAGDERDSLRSSSVRLSSSAAIPPRRLVRAGGSERTSLSMSRGGAGAAGRLSVDGADASGGAGGRSSLGVADAAVSDAVAAVDAATFSRPVTPGSPSFAGRMSGYGDLSSMGAGSAAARGATLDEEDPDLWQYRASSISMLMDDARDMYDRRKELVTVVIIWMLLVGTCMITSLQSVLLLFGSFIAITLIFIVPTSLYFRLGLAEDYSATPVCGRTPNHWIMLVLQFTGLVLLITCVIAVGIAAVTGLRA